MAIRLRTIKHNGDHVRVALCAVETDPQPDDIYLDDGDHYALAAKFSRDWDLWPYPKEWAAMDTQKIRDAGEEFARWDEERRRISGDVRALRNKTRSLPSFSRDWDSWPYPREWAAMDTQKLRDAEEELNKWKHDRDPVVT